MPRLSVLAMFLPLIAVAATVPRDDRDEARLRQRYGTPVDPDRDCRFILDGDRLRVGAPGSLHALDRAPVNVNAPRVWREVVGDFTATVRVAFRPTDRRAIEGAGPMYVNGGLTARSDDDNFATATRTQEYIDRKPRVSARSWFSSRDERYNGSATARKDIDGANPDAFYVRLRRSGNTVITSAGPDGKKWIELDRADAAWGRTVRLGVVVENHSAEWFEAEFSDFRLGPEDR